MRISDWSSDVCSSDLRYSGDELPAHPGVLLPNPRSHDSEPSGWRHWQLIPFGDLLYERRAGKGGGGDDRRRERVGPVARSEEHTSELQSLMRISYAVFCLKKKNHNIRTDIQTLDLTSVS